MALHNHDAVQADVLYALADAIRKASADGVEALETIDRLGHAVECVLSGIEISDDGFRRTQNPHPWNKSNG